MSRFVSLLIVVCCSSVFGFSNLGFSAEPRLPSLNLWDLCGFLIQSEDARVQLDFSPLQLSKLKQLRAAPEIKEIFDLRAKMLNRQALSRNGRARGNQQLRLNVRLELNDFVHRKLLDFVFQEQLDALPIVALREKFSLSYGVFFDDEIQEQCGFNSSAILKEMVEAKSNLDEKSVNAAWESCRNFVGALPQRAKLKAAWYFGEENFPKIKLPREFIDAHRNDALPFPPNDGGARFIVSDRTLRDNLEITDSQRRKLQKLLEELDKEIERLRPPSPTEGMADYNSKYFALHREHSSNAKSILKPTQQRQLGRQYAFGEYKLNPERPLLRKDIQTYFAFSDEELQDARRTAVAERFALSEKLHELNKECFNGLSDMLEPAPRQRLREVFSGVWE